MNDSPRRPVRPPYKTRKPIPARGVQPAQKKGKVNLSASLFDWWRNLEAKQKLYVIGGSVVAVIVVWAMVAPLMGGGTQPAPPIALPSTSTSPTPSVSSSLSSSPEESAPPVIDRYSLSPSEVSANYATDTAMLVSTIYSNRNYLNGPDPILADLKPYMTPSAYAAAKTSLENWDWAGCRARQCIVHAEVMIANVPPQNPPDVTAMNILMSVVEDSNDGKGIYLPEQEYTVTLEPDSSVEGGWIVKDFFLIERHGEG